MSSDREREYNPRGTPERKRRSRTRSRSDDRGGKSDPMKNDPSVIKIRGMPYDTTAMEVVKFFKDCDIVGGPDGIFFPMNDRGQPTGEAFIEMENMKDIDKALAKHKEHIGERYIEVFESRLSVMEKVKKNSGSERGRDRGLRADRERGFGGGGDRQGFGGGSDGRRGFGGGGGRGFGGGGGGEGRGFGSENRDRDRFGGRRGSGDDVSRYCVKMRGLPWEATKEDVCDFLGRRVNIQGGKRGIVINEDDRGRAAGDAYVQLESREDMEEALTKHKRDMGSRYIEVFEGNPLDVAAAKDKLSGGRGGGGFGRGRQQPTGGQYVVQLRGLPYRASEDEIADWCATAAEPTDVFIIQEGGRPSGKADVFFSSARDARRVVSEMHRRDMGNRYIECFYDGDD